VLLLLKAPWMLSAVHVFDPVENPATAIAHNSDDTTYTLSELAPGQYYGAFTVTHVDLPTAQDPYHTIDFVGTTTVIGRLDVNDGMGGPGMYDISTSSAVNLPHIAGALVSGFAISYSDAMAGTTSVHNGDLVEATINSFGETDVPKDGSGTYANVIAIRQLEPATQPASVVGPPKISVVSFSIPSGWVIDANTDHYISFHSPDYAVRDSLADLSGGQAYSVISGHSIGINYESAHISRGTTPQGFVDFENSFMGDCSNCSKAETITLAGAPAIMHSSVWETSTTTSVEAAHTDADGSVGELDVSMTGIRSDADRQFFMAFLQSIQYR